MFFVVRSVVLLCVAVNYVLLRVVCSFACCLLRGVRSCCLFVACSLSLYVVCWLLSFVCCRSLLFVFCVCCYVSFGGVRCCVLLLLLVVDCSLFVAV